MNVRIFLSNDADVFLFFAMVSLMSFSAAFSLSMMLLVWLCLGVVFGVVADVVVVDVVVVVVDVQVRLDWLSCLLILMADSRMGVSVVYTLELLVE